MRIWPDTLPRGMGESSTLSPVDQSVRTAMEAGPPRVRRTTRARLDLIEMRWRLSHAEMALFRAWFADAYWSDFRDSGALANAGFSGSGGTIGTAGLAGPDGSASLRFTENTGLSVHGIDRAVPEALAGTSYVVTATLRPVSRAFARIDLRTRGGVTRLGASIDLLTGQIAADAGVIVSTKPRGLGWHRLAVQVPVGAGASVPEVRILAGTGLATQTYTGDGSSGFDICEVNGRPATGLDLFGHTDLLGNLEGAGHGAEWFQMPVATGGGFAMREVRFASAPRAQGLSGLHFDVSATLEVAGA